MIWLAKTMTARHQIQADAKRIKLGVARHGKLVSTKRKKLTSLANSIRRRLTTIRRYRLAIVTK